MWGGIAVVALATVTAVPLVSSITIAAPPPVATEIEQAATPGSPATRIASPADVVSISQFGALSATLRSKAEQVAIAVNAPSVPGRGFTIGLYAVRRGDSVIQQSTLPNGVWAYPLNVTALPVDAIGRVMSLRIATTVAQGNLVMGQTSADLRGARAGDTVDLIASDGNARSFTLGLVAPDDEVRGTEIVMSLDQANVLGSTITTRVVIYGQFARDALDAAVAAQGLVDGYGVRVSRSWAPASPDGTLGLAQTKAKLGEFALRVNGADSITMDPDWVAANIVRADFQYIGVHAYCHRLIVDDLQAALKDVFDAGLSYAIDLTNTNTYGGCWNPRYARASADIGSVSRHAWGMAFDTNTSTNPQGGVPRMDCRVVRIFRKHNFAWGGNFVLSDGMHFEWVGEPRNTWAYPSKYCPNVPGGGIESVFRLTPTQGVSMFAPDDGSPVVEPHDR